MSPITLLTRFRSLNNIYKWPLTLKLGAGILFLFLFVAITGPIWAPYGPSKIMSGPPLSSASLEHLFGTDQLGRDVFSRVIYGTRIVLFLSLTSTFIAMIVGGFMGLLSAMIGGWFDEVLMRIFDTMISIPLMIFALLIITAVGSKLSGNFFLLIGVVVIVYTPRVARMTRSIALDLVMRDFIIAARMRGESNWSIVTNELLPNATSVLLVEFGVRSGYAPILIGTLGFLGLGVRPPIPEWGLLISENRNAILSAPLAALTPALALAFLVIGINLFTDGLARILGRTVQRGV